MLSIIFLCSSFHFHKKNNRKDIFYLKFLLKKKFDRNFIELINFVSFDEISYEKKGKNSKSIRFHRNNEISYEIYKKMIENT